MFWEAMIDCESRPFRAMIWIRFARRLNITVDDHSLSARCLSATLCMGLFLRTKGNLTEAGCSECMGRAGPSSGHRGNCHRMRCGHYPGADGVTSARRRFSPGRRTHRLTHCTLDQHDLLSSYQGAGCDAGAFHLRLLQLRQSFISMAKTPWNARCVPNSPRCRHTRSAGSDFPPGPFDPRWVLQGMGVTRRGLNGEIWGATSAFP